MNTDHRPSTILLADDHVPTRRGLRSILEGDGFTVVAEADNALDAVDAAKRFMPAVCILDVAMPGSGIAAAERITHSVPDTKVILLTVSTSREDLLDSLRAGASGYLLKSMNPERLPAAVRGVMAGEAAIPRDLVPKLLEELRRMKRAGGSDIEASRLGLTRRETEVLGLLAAGLGTSEISSRLEISATTVRRHASELMRKMQVESRDEAVEMLRRLRSA
jgi:DNA-binding NarL/FixJ family response regulator